MSPSNNKDNLARIRNNQRRSRARRKEYLEDLESKYRSCEQLGVQASAEIQAAAKRVLDENRRLRTLLHHKGVSEAEIDSFTERDESSASPPPVPTLDIMLNTRRPCKPGSVCGGGDDGGSAGKSPIRPQPVLAPRITTAVETSASPPQQQPYPLAAADDRNLSLGASGTARPPMSPGGPMHRHLPTAETGNPALLYDSSNPYPAFAPYYAIQVQSPWPYPTAPETTVPTQPDSTSCASAAHLIRGMRNHVGPELELDLGCCGSGQDCEVKNAVVFDVMDKYSHDF